MRPPGSDYRLPFPTVPLSLLNKPFHVHWIPGHAGALVNERVDQLASEAVLRAAVDVRVTNTSPSAPHLSKPKHTSRVPSHPLRAYPTRASSSHLTGPNISTAHTSSAPFIPMQAAQSCPTLSPRPYSPYPGPRYVGVPLQPYPTTQFHWRAVGCCGESRRATGTGGPRHQSQQRLSGMRRLIRPHPPLTIKVYTYLSVYLN